jgi:ribosomal protein S6
MKIFETFPEGIALVRNNYILYSNSSLKRVLSVGERSSKEDPLYELLKGDLNMTIVQQWVRNPEELKLKGQSAPKTLSVWQFLANNERGAIFKLLSKKMDLTKDENHHEELFADENPRYITLNQVNVRIAGGTDKLLVVRDVTSIVMNEKVFETKKEMGKVTDMLMRQIEEHASATEIRLQKLYQFMTDEGRQINDDSQMELRKLQYRIKDFHQLSNIHEYKFRAHNEVANVPSVIDEIAEMTQPDLKNRGIELNVIIDDHLPQSITTDIHKMKQVLLNLLSNTINNQLRGFINLKLFLIERNGK